MCKETKKGKAWLTEKGWQVNGLGVELSFDTSTLTAGVCVEYFEREVVPKNGNRPFRVACICSVDDGQKQELLEIDIVAYAKANSLPFEVAKEMISQVV